MQRTRKVEFWVRVGKYWKWKLDEALERENELYAEKEMQMKKNNSQIIREILKKANRKFAGKWMSAEDNSYIFPVDSIVFTGDTGLELNGDLESLPLAIRVTRFVNDVPLSFGSIVETGQYIVFDDNPYAIEADGNESCRYGIKFITKTQATHFISRIRKRLMQEVTALDKINV